MAEAVTVVRAALVYTVLQAPAKWRDNSQVFWNYAYMGNAVSASCSVENPANEEALFSYATARYF